MGLSFRITSFYSTHLCIRPRVFLLHSLTISSSISPLITTLIHCFHPSMQLLPELLLFIDHRGILYLSTWYKGYFWLETSAAKHEGWTVLWMSSCSVYSHVYGFARDIVSLSTFCERTFCLAGVWKHKQQDCKLSHLRATKNGLPLLQTGFDWGWWLIYR